MADPDAQARFDEVFIREFRANGLRDPEGYRLLLTHVGARSGNQRTTGLAYYDVGGRTIVVAGNSGSPKHPAWYHNLLANPQVTVERDGERWDGVATVLSGDDYAVTWDRIAEIQPSVNEFQATVERQIPLVALTRT